MEVIIIWLWNCRWFVVPHNGQNSVKEHCIPVATVADVTLLTDFCVQQFNRYPIPLNVYRRFIILKYNFSWRNFIMVKTDAVTGMHIFIWRCPSASYFSKLAHLFNVSLLFCHDKLYHFILNSQHMCGLPVFISFKSHHLIGDGCEYLFCDVKHEYFRMQWFNDRIKHTCSVCTIIIHFRYKRQNYKYCTIIIHFRHKRQNYKYKYSLSFILQTCCTFELATLENK